MKAIKYFFSMWVTLALLLAYAIACAVATWLENDFGTPSAKALIYGALWFDILHLLLALNLLGVIVFSRMWQRGKKASFLLHCSFLLIVLGAGITRYFGVEGGMHIREGESSNLVVSSEKYLTLFDKNNNEEISFPVVFTPLKQKEFSQTFHFAGKTFTLKSIDYTPLEESEYSAPILEVELSDGVESKSILLIENYVLENMASFDLGGGTFALNWGPKFITLPFSLRLDDFILERYAGSMSPSSYESIVQVIDKGESKSYKIFMNNVLDYGGYRFFQSSYDEDELGTILSVNQDPGKYPTYVGYTLLILASLWVLLGSNSRVSALRRYLKTHSCIVGILLVLMSANVGIADEGERILEVIEKVKNNSKEHSAQFSSLLVQDFGGRVKPMDSMAMDFVHKMTKKNEFLGMDYNQIILAMLVFPDEFRAIKMFPIKSPKLKDALSIPQEQKTLAFRDVFGERSYKLANYIQEANRKKPSERDTFDKEVLALDERINTAYMVYSGGFLRIFPDPNGSKKWFSPSDESSKRIQVALIGYLQGLREGIEQNSWEDASLWLDSIKKMQEQYGSDISPSKQKVSLEIFLNHSNIFYSLIFAYLLLGLALLLLSLYGIVFSPLPKLSFGISLLVMLFALLHTLGLIVRWYVGDHAPWSNAYESMIFISWASVIAGVVFFPKSYLTQAMACLLGGIVLFVANLGFMDPQIGNLVPVLKSYWLNIHVFVITASYGFLGLSLMLGLISLVLFIFRERKESINQSLLNLHCINEISMIIGLLMLTAGNFLGGVWANESWGRYWGWDPKETWALISIIIYTIILHLRFIPSLNSPYVFAVASVWGFYSILMTYFGVNYYLSGMHSYASGDNLPIPIFLWYCLGISVLLPLLAFRQRGLKTPKLHK